MTILFLTKETREKTRKYGLTNIIEELTVNCTSRPFDDAFRLFEIRYPYLYKRYSNYRAIAKVVTVKDIEVICILDILKKGDKDSDAFSLDRFRYGQEKLEKLLDYSELESFVAGEIQKGLALSVSRKESFRENCFSGSSRLAESRMPTN